MHWFGLVDPEIKRNFDGECTGVAEAPLAALAPDKFHLPPFTSAAVDRAQAYELSAPLRAAIFAESTQSEENVALNTLSFVLLLDQLSRNSLRSSDGQRRIYTHYDRLSMALVNVLFEIAPSPGPGTPHDIRGMHRESSAFRADVARRTWFLLPLMHCEDLTTHDHYDQQLTSLESDALEFSAWKNDSDRGRIEEFFLNQRKAEDSHRDLLERFSRYPHRNDVLGRPFTEQEEAFLREGGETFGTSGSGEGGKAGGNK